MESDEEWWTFFLKLQTFIEQNWNQFQYEHATLYGHGRKEFLFKCECGEQFTLSRDYKIKTSDQIRCKNCKRKANMQPNVGERAAYKRVKSDAARGGRVFDLPLDWFLEAIHQPCHYCGQVDQNSINVASKRKGEFLIKDFKYNGLDRLNNDIGYVIENVVPCCFVCNRAKNSMGYQEYIEYLNNMIQWRSNR